MNIAVQQTQKYTALSQSIASLSEQGSAMSIDEDRIQSWVSNYQGHGLEDLNDASLMNRVDSKFMLPISFLPELLQSMQQEYSVLEINQQRIFNYYNRYFDTPAMSFYRDHHNGKLNRYKVRHRTYLDTDTQFLEVKFKNNQKRTYKSRIKVDGDWQHSDNCDQFINNKVGKAFSQLKLSQQGGYQRIALANEAEAERVTLDFNLWFDNPHGSDKIKLSHFFIAELKQAKHNKRSPFYQLMSKHHFTPSSFSKYCVGCALVQGDALKQNKFKPILTRVERFASIPSTH